MGVTMLGGTGIGSHSIVGANSLINKEFPEHVLIVGNPGEVAREHVDWCRAENVTWEDYLNIEKRGEI